jgi:hypothetical protein
MRHEKIRGIGRERDWRPVFQGIADGRGGFTVALGSNVQLRVKVRDFLTGFPNTMLTPPPRVKYGSLLNELVPMVSIVFLK